MLLDPIKDLTSAAGGGMAQLNIDGRCSTWMTTQGIRGQLASPFASQLIG